MQLVEQHVIRANSPQFVAVDKATFAAKNLYNAANYLVGHHRNDEVYSLPANDDAGGGRNAQDLSRDVDR
jgi:hypothetical protein